MQKLPIFTVDAFTKHSFSGNPAAVCPLEQWLPDDLLQNIAEENNLSETVFFVPKDHVFELRWFTPRIEVDLCGHATLAAAHVLFHHFGYEGNTVRFESPTDILFVRKLGNLLILDFPTRVPQPVEEIPAGLIQGLGRTPLEVLQTRDFLAVFEDEEDIRAIEPDFSQLAKLDVLGISVTAPGSDVDFVSRFFSPRSGVNEDPVTGSAHCSLTPYWAARLGKTKLHARQLSRRGGELFCELCGERTKIGGYALTYMTGEITV